MHTETKMMKLKDLRVDGGDGNLMTIAEYSAKMFLGQPEKIEAIWEASLELSTATRKMQWLELPYTKEYLSQISMLAGQLAIACDDVKFPGDEPDAEWLEKIHGLALKTGMSAKREVDADIDTIPSGKPEGNTR